MIRAVIFDVDGTLIDTVDYHAESWERAFRKHGKDVPASEIRKHIGKGTDHLLPEFFSKREIEEFGEEMEAFRSKLMWNEYVPKFQPFPMVRELIQRILADGKHVALASSAKVDELDHYKKIAHIDDLIPDHKQTSSTDAEKSKPEPDIFHAAVDKLWGVTAEEMIVVGDTPYDATAATKAGLRIIGVRCGGFAESVLREAGCEWIYQDPADLLASYEKSPLAG